jgi:hypothetical protein
MQASSGTRIARKELRHSLDQEALVRQYLQEIGFSWNCATNISVTLRNLMEEQVRPLLDLLNRKSIPTTAGLHISAEVGDDEEENDLRHSRSSSRKRSSITNLTPQISQPHTISSGSGQSSLSTFPNHILTFPTQVPPPAKPSVSITSSTHASPSAPIATPTSSFNLSSFTDSWAPQPSPGSSPNFTYLPSSFSPPDFRKYAHPFSNFMDDPFSGNGNGSSDDVERVFGGLPLSGPSSENHFVERHLGMLGGQTLSPAPFIGFLSEGEDTHSPNFSNFLQAPFGIGFPNHESFSSSHGDNDNMDLDSVPSWRQTFAS